MSVPDFRAKPADLLNASAGRSAPLERIRWTLLEPWVFYGLIGLLVASLWAFHYFPSQDGPMHLYNAIVLRDYNQPDRTAFREFFRPNPIFVPNWLGPHLLPVLMQWMPPFAAEKVLLTAYLLLFPMSIRYALIGIRPRAKMLSIAALPFVPNAFYHMGFHDFCLSLVGFFVAIGFFARRRRHFGWTQSAMLAVILLCTYLTHLVSVAMVLPLLAFCGIGEYWLRRETLRVKISRSLPLAISLVPVSAVTLFFMLGHHTDAMLHPWPQGWVHRFYFLLSWMKAYQSRDLLPAFAVFFVMTTLSVWMLYQTYRSNCDRPSILFAGISGGLFVTTLWYVALFLVAPDGAAGGQLLGIRFAAFPLFTALLWLAAIPIGPTTFRRVCRIAVGVGIPSLLFLFVSMCLSYRELNGYLREFATITPHLMPNSVVLPIHYEDFRAVSPKSGHRISVGVDPFRHAAATGLAERGIVNLANYWATTDHQSLQWQPGLDPMAVGMDRVDNFVAWTNRTGKSIDYVIVWSGGLPHDELQGRCIASELRGFRLIYTSPVTGYIKLYQPIDALMPAADASLTPVSSKNKS